MAPEIDVPKARSESTSFLREDVSGAAGKHRIRGGQYVECLAQQNDLAVLDHAVTEEPLMYRFSRYAGAMMNRVFTKGLLGGIDIDLYVGEAKAWIHRVVQKAQEVPDVLGAFVSRLNAEVREIGEFECPVLGEQ